MSNTLIQCAHCGSEALKSASAVNRSRRAGAPVYCGRKCAGLARRKNKTVEQRKAEKAEYDRQRRKKLGEVLLAKKRAAYRRALLEDLEKVRAAQKLNRDRRKDAHAEYCRQPEYREWKKSYDRKYRANKTYGPFADAFLVVRDLEEELASRASKYERYRENGTLNKTQRRKREYEQATYCVRA